MVNARVCLCLFVFLVSYRVIGAEPTFGSAFCNLFCDTSDDGSDDDDYYDIFDIFGACDWCPSSSSSSTSEDTQEQKPVNIVLPPSNGLNLSVSSSPNGAVVMNLMPWPAGPAPPAAAKPQATTAAPAAATTAAGDKATTAAATTKKA